MFGYKVPWWVFAVGGAVVVGSLGITTTWSYIKTGWRGVGKAIREATPISFDLERLNNELKDIEPEIRRNLAVIAQMEVDVENLEEQIAKLEKEQNQAFAEMKKLREALGTNAQTFQFAGKEYRRFEVESDLSRRLEVYKARQAELEVKKQVLEERRRNLELAQRKLTEYRQRYDQLLVQLDSLRAQHRTLEMAKQVGSVKLDESRLGVAEQLAKEIESRIRVGQRLLEVSEMSGGGIRLEADSRSAAERFDELFGSPAGEQAAEDPGT